ncbi:MAG: Fic family protein [Flavobacteriaceae bacterium]|nr:Fic family protein [Flavobacteriaceae bacterium]
MREIEKTPGWDLSNLNIGLLTRAVSGDLKAVVDEINEEYLYWDKVKYKARTIGIEPYDLWTVVKFTRTLQQRDLQINGEKFSFSITESTTRLLHKFDLDWGGKLGTKSILRDDAKDYYLISSIMEEAIASSQIEGAVTTRKMAKDMLRKKRPPRNKSEQMIINNYETISYIASLENKMLNHELLLEIHRLMTKDTMDSKEDEGRYRTNDDVNVVDAVDGTIVHHPPAHGEIEKYLRDLFDFFNDTGDGPFIHPIIKGCIIHFMIGYIHPFVDGNGRTARALYYWYLIKEGYWLIKYISISRLIVKTKVQYAKAYIYSENDSLDLSYFIQYKLKTMKLGFKSLREYIDRKIAEKQIVNRFQLIDGVNERQGLILTWLNEEDNLLLTVKEVESRLNVANQTARNDLEGLVKLGLVVTFKVNLKTKAYTLPRYHKFHDFEDEPPF